MFVTDPIGILGEAEAAKMLEAKGYTILEHNWRMGHLEVDIIAENKKEIVFVEVKTRTSAFGEKLPEEYVDEDKKQRVGVAANAYVKMHKSEKTPRFDIIGIIVEESAKKIIYRNHLESAYYPQVRTISSGSHSGRGHWRKKR